MRRTAIPAIGSVLAMTLSASSSASAATLPAYIGAAVADAARPEADRQRDTERKPAETLAFAGVKPGDAVMELAAGRGYYTRLLSAAVGPQGKVLVVVAPPKPDAPADAPVPGAAVREIAADPHYANVAVIVQRLGELAPPVKVDLVWTSQNYHDFHNLSDISISTINRAVFQALKPGGTYLVLDHAAAPGSGTRDTSTLHRIDEAAVIKEVQEAGFELKGKSNILRNPADDHTAKVFDAPIRGHTDQFILKFGKP
jgi:predicted methyltransferase